MEKGGGSAHLDIQKKKYIIYVCNKKLQNPWYKSKVIQKPLLNVEKIENTWKSDIFAVESFVFEFTYLQQKRKTFITNHNWLFLLLNTASLIATQYPLAIYTEIPNYTNPSDMNHRGRYVVDSGCLYDPIFAWIALNRCAN